MAIKKMKAMTNGTRHMSKIVNDELDKVRPEKSLTVPLKSAYGRDNYGHRTARNRQKGHKRLYRIIDLSRLGRSCNRKNIKGKKTCHNREYNRCF